ncbi:MFS transporter [Bremerella cremea]|uniref:MFS transporter n=1 Tax=Bremerella cremea TaxID=1031537 RepID=UPI0031F08082
MNSVSLAGDIAATREAVDSITDVKQPGACPPSLLALTMGCFCIGTTEFLPAALLPTIAADLKVTLSSAGLLISGYALGVTLLTPFLASFSSGISRKPLLIGLMVIFAITNLAAAFAPNYETLLAIRFLSAIPHGVFIALASTAVSSLVAKGREAGAIGILFSGLSIAMATVVPAGAILGQLVGWRMAFAATSGLGLLTIISIGMFVPKLPLSENRLSLGRQFAALMHPQLLLALAMTAVGYTGTFATLSYMTAFLEEVSGFSPTMVTMLFALLGVCVTFGNLVGGRVADRGLHPALVGGYALVAVSLLALWLAAPYQIAVVPAFLLFAFTMFAPGAGLQLLAVEQARRYLPGAEDVAAGLNQSAFNLGIAIGALVGGQVVASPLGLAATPAISILPVVMAIGLSAWSWKRDTNSRELAAESA